ncbi:MAG: hypothetical protein A2W31_11120 [Planctomycetes bacterium RBG_16_64_10]|nr:MAG: hypothetical protein A2W31_11120 [Planctomycetes bacterium RBG_16_64_10]
MTETVSRRDFLGATAGGILLAGGLAARPLQAAEQAGWPTMPPVQIQVVYLGTGGGAWPKPEFDAPAEVAKFQRYLADVQQRLGDVRFVGGQLIPNEVPAAAQLAAKLGDADALLLIHLSFGDATPFLKFVETGLPTAIFSQPFSGHDWMYIPAWQKDGQRVILTASSDYADLDRAVALLRVPVRMRQTRILLIGSAAGTEAGQKAEQIRARLGPEVIPVSVAEMVAAHRTVAANAAVAEAEAYWLSQAKQVVEPSRDEVVKSAAMYLAMKKLMIERGARAITIRCLGGIPIDTLGYPCLGFSKLNDLGLVGACEADMDSTLTMLMFGYAFGIPGFISDPLFDTSKNAVIHAHCVAPTKMDGPAGARAPFLIRSHRDDNRGASLEAELRVGQEITCAKLANLDTMLISTGKIIALPDFDDRGCRTQIVTEVADARAMLANWGSGVLPKDMMTLLHRVVFYGNRLDAVRDMAILMGQQVVIEG